MYEYVDRPVAGLESGNRFLIWAMRHWVQAMHERHCPPCVIGPAFVKWKMVAGLAPFQAMMATLNMHALRDINFAPAQCGLVSEDEAMLLAMIGGIGGRSPGAMAETLALIIDEEQVKPLQDAMLLLSDAMAQAHILPDRAARTTRLQ